MSIECPNCKGAREQSADAAEGWLHPSGDYPELQHCNCCGRYYRVLNGLVGREAGDEMTESEIAIENAMRDTYGDDCLDGPGSSDNQMNISLMARERRQEKAGSTPDRLPRFGDDGRPVRLWRTRKRDGSGEPMGTAGSADKVVAESTAGASDQL